MKKLVIKIVSFAVRHAFASLIVAVLCGMLLLSLLASAFIPDGGESFSDTSGAVCTTGAPSLYPWSRAEDAAEHNDEWDRIIGQLSDCLSESSAFLLVTENTRITAVEDEALYFVYGLEITDPGGYVSLCDVALNDYSLLSVMPARETEDAPSVTDADADAALKMLDGWSSYTESSAANPLLEYITMWSPSVYMYDYYGKYESDAESLVIFGSDSADSFLYNGILYYMVYEPNGLYVCYDISAGRFCGFALDVG